MKKIILTLFISLYMTVSLFTPGKALILNAEDKSDVDVEASVGTVITAINELEQGEVIKMTQLEANTLRGIFDDFTSVFGKIGSIIAPINGAVSFLRMIGVMKDPTASALANIQVQLADMSEKLTQMDAKLNQIITQMNTLQATEEFHFRKTQAVLFRQNWIDFRNTYMVNALNATMVQYEAGLKNAWIGWFSASNENTQIDTRSVLIWYKSSGAGHKLQTTLMNGFDAEHDRSDGYNDKYTLYKNEFDNANDKLISLNSDFFADASSITYDVDTYRTDLINYIKSKITGAETAGVTMWNLTKEDLTDALLDEIANQAVDMITYKLSNWVINSSAQLPSTALSQYQNYCNFLLDESYGMNALFQSIYYTHSFEFETKQDLLNLINLFSLQTGVYSAFVANLIGESAAISNKDKEDFTIKMCKTLNTLAGFKKTALTGMDRYCYLTNSIIDYGGLHISSEASIDWKTVLANVTYENCHGGSMSAQITDSSNNRQDPSRLVGDASALLISYVVRSNSQTFDHDYMNKHLAVNEQVNRNGLVTTYRGEESMTQDTEIKLSSYLVTGDYFEGNPDVSLKSLPSKAEYGYVNIHRMASGSLFDGKNSNVQVNRPLLAIAVYGENHAAWLVDESALLYGPKDTGTLSYDTRRDTTYEDTFMTKYNTSIRESIDYNVLLSLPVKENEALINQSSPLNRYLNNLESSIEEKHINRDANHVHSWDDGTIIREASEDIPGIKKYSCIGNGAHSYTVLYTNYQMAELTFDLDGGRLDGFDNELSRQFRIGSTIRLPEAPKKDGYTFQYWSESEHQAESEYEVKGDRAFKAIWVRSWDYKLDGGSYFEWYNESRNVPDIRIVRAGENGATLSHFKELRLFDTVVKPGNYETEDGSLIIKLKPGYLRSLPSGVLKFEALFDDGSVEFVLNVKNGLPDNGKTEYRLPLTGIGY